MRRCCNRLPPLFRFCALLCLLPMVALVPIPCALSLRLVGAVSDTQYVLCRRIGAVSVTCLLTVPPLPLCPRLPPLRSPTEPHHFLTFPTVLHHPQCPVYALHGRIVVSGGGRAAAADVAQISGHMTAPHPPCCPTVPPYPIPSPLFPFYAPPLGSVRH